MAVNPQTAPTRDPIIEADPDVSAVSANGQMQVVAKDSLKLYDASDSSLGDDM